MHDHLLKLARAEYENTFRDNEHETNGAMLQLRHWCCVIIVLCLVETILANPAVVLATQ